MAELRRRAYEGHARFGHRDSTLVLDDGPWRDELSTPADVCGLLAGTFTAEGRDATVALSRQIKADALKASVLEWLPALEEGHERQFWIATEVWGDTRLHRHALADQLRRVLAQAFPRWHESAAGAHFVIKADEHAAFLALRLRANFAVGEDTRPGSLRPHLAAGLLALAGTDQGDAVLDPFMGTGTILRAAHDLFEANILIGADTDAEVYRRASERLANCPARLYRESFTSLSLEHLPSPLRLVSNLPFGERFEQVPTDDLLDFLGRVLPRATGVALLMSRAQAREVSRRTRLRVKNVLVLGQPAAIATLRH
ncbi:MAG TPA: DNA methyltransferase [Chloroflexota bacterium]|nr:DNA methyltransferase [Chloroflexota bacterium]